MNKAFVREVEDNGQRFCPRCRSLGIMVTVRTVQALVTDESPVNIADPAYFCSFPTCDVAYFDEYDRVIAIGQLKQPIYPKDPDAPLCPCFGLTRDDIEADLQEGGVRRVRAVVEQSKTAAACCALKSPSGQSCVADVQRYYIRRRSERQGHP